MANDLSVHLPPAAPIMLFYYFYPSRQDPLRRLVKYTVAGAAISWMHSEATKYRRFSPLPGMTGVNVRRPNLPPFLPEGEQRSDLVKIEDAPVADGGKGLFGGWPFKAEREQSKSTKREEEASDDSHNQHHHLWDPFQSFGTLSAAYRTWLEGHHLRNKHAHHLRRMRAKEQLLAIKESSAARASNSTVAPSSKSKSPFSTSTTTASASSDASAGYALVTGASTGIGRALAVELARYDIPLILVARDAAKLKRVAEDIETYYGVACRVLRADLSEPDCAQRIHDATSGAGLEVDILVNNAGVCDHGRFIEQGDDGEGGLDAVSNMIQVNINTATRLSRLYGRDMKERRRGRILYVSSMSGVLPGCPSVAVYAATKAFGKSLSMSLGREMEP